MKSKRENMKAVFAALSEENKDRMIQIAKQVTADQQAKEQPNRIPKKIV